MINLLTDGLKLENEILKEFGSNEAMFASLEPTSFKISFSKFKPSI